MREWQDLKRDIEVSFAIVLIWIGVVLSTPFWLR